MNKAVSWNPKNAVADPREMARDAARRAGMSVDDWLRFATQDDQRLETDAAARLEAVAARLAKRAEPTPPREGGERRRVLRPAAFEPAQRTRFEEIESRLRDETARHPREAPSSRPEPRRETSRSIDSEQAHDAEEPRPTRREQREPTPDPRAVVAQQQTASALSTLAEWVERAEARRVDDNDALAQVSERLASFEHNLSRRPPESDPATKSALVRLETRLDGLAKRVAEPNRSTARVEATLRDLGERMNDIGRKIAFSDGRPARDRDDFTRLEAKLAAVLAAVEAPRVAAPPPVAAPQPASPARAAPSPFGTRLVGDAVAEIARRQLDLDTPPSRRALLGDVDHHTLTVARPDPDIGGLKRQIAQLSERFDARMSRAAAADRSEEIATSLKREIAAMAERLEKRIGAAQTSPRAEPDGLKAQIAALADRLETRIDRASTQVGATVRAETHPLIGGLQGEITQLVGRLDTLRADPSEKSLEALREAVADMARLVGEMPARASFSALEDALRALTDRVEALRDDASHPERSMVGAVDLADLNTQTRQLQDLLVSAASRPVPLDQIERQIAQLGMRIDTLAAKPAPASVDLDAAVAGLRTAVEQAVPTRALQTIERRVEALSEKLDAAFHAPDTRLASLATRIDDVHQTVAARLATLPGIDTAPLEGLVRDLSSKIEAVSRPSEDASALKALDRQMNAILARLDRTEVGADALGSLERSMNLLLAQMEASRVAAVAAAEATARDIVADAMGNRGSAHAAAEVARDIDSLRSAQNVADERVHSTLSAVHQTLEKMLDRLANLEDEVADARIVPAHQSFEQTGSAVSAESRPVFAPAPQPRPQPRVVAPAAPELRRALADQQDAEDEADLLIEPGAGFVHARAQRPTIDAPHVEIGPIPTPIDKEGAPNFIAAARRAAREAAMQSVATGLNTRKTVAAKKTAPSVPIKDGEAGLMDGARSFVAARTRPVLLGLAGLMLLLGAVQVMRVSLRSPDIAPTIEAPRAPVIAPAPKVLAPPADAPLPDAAPKKLDKSADAGLPAIERTPIPAAPLLAAGPSRGIDPAPVGSLARRAAPAVAALEPSPGAGAAQEASVRAAAEAGDLVAQYDLGSRLVDSRDLKGAAGWFEKAATAGLVPAQYRLGSFYEKGLGVPRDASLAQAWYQRAAEKGNARAMHNLAVLTAEGVGGKPDYATASSWFRKAAEYGIRDSQYNLAILNARGLGTEQSLGQAYLWFALAAAQGDTDAAKKRDEVAAKLDAKGLQAAQARVAAFKPLVPDPAANDVTPPPGGYPADAKARPRATGPVAL